jgi:hypothetical protein
LTNKYRKNKRFRDLEKCGDQTSPERLIPMLFDEQVQQLADLRDHSPKHYLREGAGAIVKPAQGL